MTIYRIGVRSPGWTWERRAEVWRDAHTRSYIWRRSAVRVFLGWMLYLGGLLWLVWLFSE